MRGYYPTMFSMTASTDRLIELILTEDKNVLRELLTTDRVVVDAGADARYYGEFVGPKAAKPKAPPEETPLPQCKSRRQKERPASALTRPARQLSQGGQDRCAGRLGHQAVQNRAPAHHASYRAAARHPHPSQLARFAFRCDGRHAILRRRWIRERLLGDAVPDVPITVDAMLPDEPQSTLRERMRQYTREEYCWKCHQKMDPLGLPFQMYNHLGMYRTQELGKPVDTSGEIIDSGDPALDGPVGNALELIDKLAHSEHMQQVFVRHAFRYWLATTKPWKTPLCCKTPITPTRATAAV